MNIVDTSGWLEYFSDGPNAECFAAPLKRLDDLIVPTITLYEVFKVVRRDRNEDMALQAVALMQQARVIDLTPEIALEAAKISTEQKIPMADSIILATARLYGATVWTQDEDFSGLPDVRFYQKK